jgi:hypothetical protein
MNLSVFSEKTVAKMGEKKQKDVTHSPKNVTHSPKFRKKAHR